jgi:predicted dehydrogenase
MADTIHVGVVGAGNIARRVHLPILSLFKEVTIDYVADVNDPSELARLYNARAIILKDDPGALPESDVALLATPVGAREPYFREFGRRGTALFSEKPFAPDKETHERFLGYSERVTCNYMRTCYSAPRQVKKLLEAGTFGALRGIDVGEGGIIGPTGKAGDHYQTRLDLSAGGILMEHGCHTLSQLTLVLSEFAIRTVKASITRQGDFDVDAQVTFEVRNGEPVSLNYSLTSVRPIQSVARFAFDKAVLTYQHTRPESRVKIHFLENPEDSFDILPDNRWAISDNQAYFLKWKSFIETIRRGEKIDAMRETSYDTTRLISETYSKASLIKS